MEKAVLDIMSKTAFLLLSSTHLREEYLSEKLKFNVDKARRMK